MPWGRHRGGIPCQVRMGGVTQVGYPPAGYPPAGYPPRSGRGGYSGRVPLRQGTPPPPGQDDRNGVDSSWLLWKFHRLFVLTDAKIKFEKRFPSHSPLRFISLLRVYSHRAKATSDNMLTFSIDINYRSLEFTCLTMNSKRNRKTSRLRLLLWET